VITGITAELLKEGCDYGDAKNETNPWGSPYNVRCTVGGKPVGKGVYDITIPGSNTLPDRARTWLRNATDVNVNPLIGDWGRFAPWRAPGASKIQDPCGVLCDHCHDPDDPNRPALFNGSALPLLKSPPAKWKAGSVAEAGWGLAVNHGGGYQYRVCKKGQPMTEACFQKGALEFATTTVSPQAICRAVAPVTVIDGRVCSDRLLVMADYDPLHRRLRP